MADYKDGHPEAEKKASGGQALVQIGHYVLGETLGIGTFGKTLFNLSKFFKPQDDVK